MPVKRRKAKQRRVPIPSNVLALLDDSEPKNTVRFFLTDIELRGAWAQVRDEILVEWAEEWPGTRPLHWWRFSAPDPRRRLGGIGTSSHECRATAPYYVFGIPACWVNQWEVDYYNGRAVDIHVERIGVEYSEGHFAGLAIDPDDPPRYESQASYLERHGLFLPGEKDRLSKADFEFEVVMPYSDPDEAA